MTKLIRCRECTDIVMLAKGPLRTCLCTKSAGLYTDQRRIRVSGPCQVLGMANGDLRNAHGGRDYPWWVIVEPNADLIQRVEIPFVRDPDDECKEYREGDPINRPDCETDGHYLCKGCVYNHHRVKHNCRNGDCAFPDNVEED